MTDIILKKKGEKKHKDQTPLLSLSGTRKVVSTPTNPFETAGTDEVFVPKEIITRRIQDIFPGPNKGRKADHYLVVWEGYPLQKDYTWEPTENLYGQEELVETYEKWLKADNDRLDIEERERKIAKRLTTENLQNAGAEKCRKDDTLIKNTKGKQSNGKGTFDQHVADDEAEARDDGDSCDGVIGAEGVDTEVNRRSRHRRFRTVVRTEFINTTINNSHTGQET